MIPWYRKLDADWPRVILVMGAFSPNGASAPTAVAANASSSIPNFPGSAGANQGWGPAGFGKQVASVVRTSTGLFTVTFANVGKVWLGGGADLLSDDTAHTYWAQASGNMNIAAKTWTINTLQSSGAVPGAAPVDIPNTSKPVISFWAAFGMSDQGVE